MANLARAQVLISGRVQGVFYRAYTRDQAKARDLGVTVLEEDAFEELLKKS